MIESTDYIIILGLILILVVLVASSYYFSSNPEDKERIKILLERQDNLQKNIIDILENNISKIDSKFEKTNLEQSNNLNFIREKIGVIDKAQENISSLSENVLNLKNILSNTAKRGRFGEMLLENIIKDQLPKENYEFQKTLSNNTRVDCMITSPGPVGKICIDAKFPREGYDKLMNSKNKFEKNSSMKSFKSDILKHIDDVSNKYIIPGETAELALVFIPSESIYLEIFNCFPEISKDFYNKKSYLISPTTLWVILNSIESFLRDKRIKDNASVIQNQLKLLSEEIRRLDNRVNRLNSHFSNAQKDIDDISTTTKKINNKTKNILGLNVKD